MTVLSRSKIVLILLSLAFFSSTSLADTVGQESAKLNNLKQTLQKQQQNYSDIQAEIKDYPEKLKEVKADLENGEAELAEAKTELQNLKIEASKPGSDLDRDIKLKEHSVKMAERRASRERRSLERTLRDEASLKEEESKIKNTVDRLTRQVANQERQLAETKAIALRQEQAINTPKPTIDIPTPAIKQSVQPQSTKEVVPTPAPVEKEPDIIAKTVEVAPAPKKQIVLSEQEFESYLVAERIMKELEEKAKIGGDYKDLILKGSDIADTKLSHVGDRSFRGEAVVVAGDQRIRIKNSRFRMSIPEQDDGKTYIFVVDQKRSNSTNLYYFKKSLIALIGENPTQEKTVQKNSEIAAKPVSTTQQTVKAKLTKDNLTDEDTEALEVAKEQMAFLEELKSNQGDGKPTFSKLVLSGNDIETDIEMEYLYHDQYVTETVVESGRQVIKVNSNRFRISIPENDGGEVYKFYVDASSPQRLKVTYFKKALLNLIN